MNLEKHICNLLYSHECVIVPDFGGFITNYEAASIQNTTHTILPPRQYLVFNSGLTINDGLLATEISSYLKCSFEEAMQLIRREVNAWHKRLRAGKTIMLLGIGTFMLNRDGKMEFKPEPEQNFFGETFGMNPLVIPPLPKRRIRQKEQFRRHKIVTKDSVRTIRRMAMAAAITVPLVAAGIWSFMNYDTLKQYAMQHSGITAVFQTRTYENSVSAPDAYPSESIIQESLENSMPDLDIKPSGELVENATDEEFNAEIPSGEATIAEVAAPVATESVNVGSKAYYIIVGSFESMDNARHLADELEATGWNAKVIDSGNGMHRVSITSLFSKQEALLKLESIRQESNPGAWLLRM